MVEAKQDKPNRLGNWISGIVFGIAFGFLLQKAGVSDYNVLIGALRLTDLTVIRVILSAILVGSIAIYVLGKFGMVRPHTKPTHYASNIIGGLIFGVGFGLLGYCPGTGAAAIGQGSWDAGWGIFGMVIGSYIYALTASNLKKMSGVGDRGKLSVPELIHINPGIFIIITSIIFVLLLSYIHQYQYVNKLNELTAGTEFANMKLEDIIIKTAGQTDKAGIFSNAAQVWNHTFYWNSLSPKGGGRPSGKIGKKIESDFGSYDNFIKQFAEAGVAQFGSGWVWLVEDGGVLKIIKTPNAENPMSQKKGESSFGY